MWWYVFIDIFELCIIKLGCIRLLLGRVFPQYVHSTTCWVVLTQM